MQPSLKLSKHFDYQNERLEFETVAHSDSKIC